MEVAAMAQAGKVAAAMAMAGKVAAAMARAAVAMVAVRAAAAMARAAVAMVEVRARVVEADAACMEGEGTIQYASRRHQACLPSLDPRTSESQSGQANCPERCRIPENGSQRGRRDDSSR